MGVWIARRILWMIPTLWVISMISFGIIQLPPGDYITSHLEALQSAGENVKPGDIERLRRLYNLDDPFHIKYLKWFNDLLPYGFSRTSDGAYFWHAGPDKSETFRWQWPHFKWPYMGWSLEHERPVGQLISERLLLTVVLSILTLFFTWALAIPIGIYSAVRQYSFGDYLFTFLGFLGLATPSFLLALVMMYVAQEACGLDVGGLFSPDYQTAPWSWAKVGDLMAHIWVPMLVLGMGGTAGLIRILRGNLLDELRKQYVITARAKGLPRVRLLMKYPVRVAINPIISTIGWLLPGIVSGSVIVAVVMNLPTVGPLLLQSLMSQDMYMAGSMVMMMASLTVVGTLVSDILLVIVDPRIRYERKAN
jgi:peptide/nickel transport system permease protein